MIFRFIVVMAVLLPTWSQAEEIQVGMAVREITPPVGFRTGGGYDEVISTGIDDPLFAKAVVFRQGKRAAAIVISDLLSVPPDMSLSARQRASETTGIPLENIVVAATHNHGSPEYWGSLRDIAHEVAIKKQGEDPHETVDYQALLVDAWVSSISDAWNNAKPVTIELTMAQQHGLAFNRRFHMIDGSVRFNPGVGNPEIVRVAGPVDVDLPFLLFRSVDGGQKAIGSLTTFAMHTAVHGGTTFSADFPTVLQNQLRRSFNSEFISIFAEGTAGDINHIDVGNRDQLRDRPEVDRIGRTLANTITADTQRLKKIEPDLAVVSKTVLVPFQPVSEQRAQESIELLQDQKKSNTPFLTLVAAWRDLHRRYFARNFPDQRKPLEVQAIRLSRDTAIVTLPHEVFVEIGLAIKATSPFRNTVVISLANDVDFYIPTRRAFSEGSYEVMTCPLDPGCGELLLRCAQETLLELSER